MTEKTITTTSNLPNVQKFVREMGPAACAAEGRWGLPAEAMLAQAALETGWGGHILRGKDSETGQTVSSNNLFNIKKGSGWQGPVVLKRVHEYDKDGKKYWTMDPFRRYEDYRESFEDYCRLIKTVGRYGPAVRAATDPAEYLRKVQECGYATDPGYASKCIKIMSKYLDVTVVNQPDPPAPMRADDRLKMEDPWWVILLRRLFERLRGKARKE